MSHYHYYQGDINVEQPTWMAGTTRAPRNHTRIRQTPGGGDGSSSGDEGDSLPGGGGPGRGQPEDLKPLREEQENHRMEIQETMGPQVVEDIHPGMVHLEEKDSQDHQEEDHLVPLETQDPLEIKEPQVHLDHEDINDLQAHRDPKDM